ncbi:MAG: hypothetical protein JWP44_1573 [Mucilaginibacter sp.]|nr:hypothetical protein [Mucilaginibacter sp.]
MPNKALTQDNSWPLPKFYFKVLFSSLDSPASFQEVSGLETESPVNEYRQAGNQLLSTKKFPVMAKTGNVTMRKGIFVNEAKFSNWHLKFMGPSSPQYKENVVIQLLDENGARTMSWTLGNACLIKMTGTDLMSESNEIAIESLEIAFETLAVTNG